MGMDGGIEVFETQDLINNWSAIIISIIENMEPYSFSWDYEKQDFDKTRERAYDYLYAKPKSKEEVCDILSSIHRACDTPALIGDYLIMSTGDNVPDPFYRMVENIRSVINSRYIETWT